ncbi:MAG: cell division protein FtsZ [Alphaproteobacteria bacterium]|nr:cell division protein FtsZ [Alphaproteobacteria bacterium]
MIPPKTQPSPEFDLRPRISVIGVGGAGSNAVNNMIRAKLEGVSFSVANTDAQALEQSLVDITRRIQLGLQITQGLGAGSKPDVGRAAAEESIEEVIRHLQGSNMVFITAGMGGGTGTGAAPVIARAARESGILTVGVVTKPFHFEGSHRSRSAERGIEELQQYVDTLIVIPNQNLFRIANERTTFADAFKMADDVLYSGVRGVTDLMMMPGLINLDFADIRAVMAEMGKAMMGTGEAEGDRRALDAAEAAISNPLLDDVSMKGAKGVLINITGGYDMTLYEVDEAANRIREDVESEANIIFGSTFDEKLNGRIRVSVVATGIGALPQSWMQDSTYQPGRATGAAPAAAGAKASNPPAYSGFPAQSSGQSPASQKQTNSGAPSPYAMPTSSSPETREGTNNAFESVNPGTSSGIQEETLPSSNPHQEQDVENSDSYYSEKNTDFQNKGNPYQSRNPYGEKQEKKRVPSLFERFTGVNRQRGQNAAADEFIKTHGKPTEEEKDAAELLDIPAFLRRGNN